MRQFLRGLRVGLTGFVLVIIAVAGSWFLTDPDVGKRISTFQAATRSPRRPPPTSVPRSDPSLPLFSENFIDDSGNTTVARYSLPIEDRRSLTQCYKSAEGRARRGISDLQSQLDQLAREQPRPPDYQDREVMLQTFMGILHMYDGQFREAGSWFEKAAAENHELPRELRANLRALQGLASLRRGEIENCVACLGPSSCIFPIDRSAVHQFPDGSRDAVRWFTEYLNERPTDLGVRWLLNIAYMTLGEYPGRVPTKLLIPISEIRSKGQSKPFLNIAPLVGLDSRGPNMLGGSAFDDFNGDGRPDILVLSGDWDLGGSLFVNRGDGRFEDRGVSAGLADQRMSVNLIHADYDNDGDLDFIALRGGWETPYRLSLLRNNGDGVFGDVTVTAGLSEPIATQSAVWGDFDNDGWLDLYVVGEYDVRHPAPANLCRLYRNRGNGTFENIAEKANVLNAGWAKGASWGDYDDDGDLDLYVSNMGGPNRLYRNNGDRTFTDVAPDLAVTEPHDSFSCWFWDYDNDGRLDLFVTGFMASLPDIVADMLAQPAKGEKPRLYRNLGAGKFQDVTAEVGLNRITLPMGSNLGDIDNDGFLDVFLATGRPSYAMLIPDLMFRNVEGRRFEDVTTFSGTGHLQKGHSVSFADWDDDGDLDLFVEVGGQTPGDKAHNVLFQNPGNDHHWIKVKLLGTKTNRGAIGAKIRVDIESKEGQKRSIYRTVGNNSSFGGNSLVQSIGLENVSRVARLSITWPTSRTTQTFHDLAADQAIEITEGSSTYRVLHREPITSPSR